MSPRTDTHRRIVDDLTRHHAGEVAEAIRRLMDARPALPGAGGQGGGGRVKGSHADPTLSLAMKPDRVAREIAQLDDVLRRMSVDAQWLRSFVDRWQPHAPTDRDRREVEKANTPDDGCEHHAAAGIFEHAERGPSTVAGNLALPMRLCNYCYQEVYRKGVLPRGEQLDREHRLGKPLGVTVVPGRRSA